MPAPTACGKLDYVGLDYYWGISTLGFGRIAHLFAASEQKYANAPVWPQVLRDMLHEHANMFPGKPIFVIENGSVDVADSSPREPTSNATSPRCSAPAPKAFRSTATSAGRSPPTASGA